MNDNANDKTVRDMNDFEVVKLFLETARAIAKQGKSNHFEISFETGNDKKYILKVDLIKADDMTEIEEKHWNECRQISRYDAELREAINNLKEITEKGAANENNR